jgi:ABC-type branched-subunit amino acid transport system permease subunit
MQLRSSTLLGLVALVLFAGLPLIVSSWVAADFGIYFAYAILAVSLGFLWGHAGMLSLGHAVYFGIGAYTMSVVTLGMVPGMPDLRSTWVGIAAAVLLPAVAAGLVGVLFFGGRRGLKGAFLGIVTLALSVVVERLAINSSWLGGMNGLMNVPPVTLGLNGGGPELFDPIVLYYVMLVVLAVVTALMIRVQTTRFGLALASVRENELRASTLGHDVAWLKIRAYALSGGVAGLSGALFVTQFGFVSPSLIGFVLSADVLIWVALGGRDFLVAAALGAIAVRYLESRLSNAIGAAWPLALGAIFMASVILFPKGVFGQAMTWLDSVRARPARPPVKERVTT